MRAAPSLRSLLLSAALLATACGDRSDFVGPEDPPAVGGETPDPEPSGPREDFGYWADGYLYADQPTRASYSPLSGTSLNRSGGAMSITKVAGTSGRYVARFKGLSALLGTTRNTVRVTASGDYPTYCRPVGAFLVRDSVEVRCFRMGTGAAANSTFFLQVVGKRDDRAFAFASQPTAASYSAPSSGSWNPAGATRVYRDGVGQYRVVFANLGARLTASVAGHVQDNGVGTNKAHCKVPGWSGSPDLTVTVVCFTPAGVPVDTKFTALFTPPSAHLAYAWADAATASEYHAYRVYASNPVGGSIVIQRHGVGRYEINWTGVTGEIRVYGNAQVMAYGEDGTQCKAFGIDTEYVEVQCYASNGVAIDSQFLVALGS